MTEECFDVQAAFLYEVAPDFDPVLFLEFCGEWTRHHGLPEGFTEARAPQFTMVGCGLLVTVEQIDTPLPKAAFEGPLEAPILKAKKFDFFGAIEMHRARILITVGEAAQSSALEQNAKLVRTGSITTTPQELKLKVLHMTMQGLAAMAEPLLVDFCPSMSLLAPAELERLRGAALPVPILFQAEPTRQSRTRSGARNRGIVARKSEILLGAMLELDAIPKDMTLTSGIDLLTALFEKKYAGEIPLDHGDSFRTEDDRKLWVRHERSGSDVTPRIVVSFEDPSGTTRRDDAPKGKADFQARLALIRETTAAQEIQGATTITEKHTLGHTLTGESPEDLRERIQSTISIGPEVSGNSSGRFIGLPMIVACLGAVVVFIVLSDTKGEQSAALGKAQSAVFSLLKHGITAPEPGTRASRPSTSGSGIQIMPARER